MNIASRQIDSISLPYKRRLAYLQNKAGQYIDTGIIPSAPDFAVDCKLSKGNRVSAAYYCGVTDANGSNSIGIANQWYYCIYMKGFSSWPIVENGTNKPYTVNFSHVDEWHIANDKRYCKRDGVVVEENNELVSDERQFTTPIYIFRSSGRHDSGNSCISRFYWFKIFNRRSLVMSLIPVISLDDEPCMYDEVSGKLFKNAGTGTFGYGELTSGGDMK